jgi:translation initiation factor 5B
LDIANNATKNVDHGKTTLLDCVRGTSVTALEPGELTQHVGASYVPSSVINKLCGELLKKLNVELKVPGLLFIDTPGHAAFMSMRRRGGSIADLAILVIDVNEGFQEQTDESLNILKQFKVPFVVAATKIDKVQGWYPQRGKCFLDSFEFQRDEVKEELDKKIYLLVSQLAERGFEAERIDRVRDFKKQIAIVPTSGITGEGIPELLVVLAGLAQQFLKEKLRLSEICRGSVLEVKETVGFGVTIDAIIYDGEIGRGDFLIIGGKEPIVTRVKALLKPRPLGELRVEKKFESVEKVQASAGVKIAAPNLEMVIAGSPLIAVKSEEDVEKAKELVRKEVEEVEFAKEIEGVVLKADTLGSLEAMIKLLKDEKIPIRKAEVGHVTKQDIIEVQNVKDDLRRVVLAFNVKILDEASELAQNLKIKIFQNNIIYRLMEDYKKWCFEEKERKIREKLEKVSRPVKIKLLKGFTFRTSKPCIVGVEVLAGVLKPGVLLRRKDGKIIDRVKEIQSEGKRIEEAKPGDRVAISMDEPTMGRQIKEGDILISVLTPEDLEILKELWDRISDSEKELIKELTESS